jgi:hypothetical protein
MISLHHDCDFRRAPIQFASFRYKMTPYDVKTYGDAL